jgi:hypothetical protein
MLESAGMTMDDVELLGDLALEDMGEALGEAISTRLRSGSRRLKMGRSHWERMRSNSQARVSIARCPTLTPVPQTWRWLARSQGRAPRGREQLARLVDYTLLDEVLAGRARR